MPSPHGAPRAYGTALSPACPSQARWLTSAIHRPPGTVGQEPTMLSSILGSAAKYSPKVRKSEDVVAGFERKTLWRVSRGWPQLGALRAIMEQVYALFDRRCRTQTALDKLAKLRRRVRRFTSLGDTLQKLFAPTLDKALTFLDDKLLPSTSNAVERGNRRYRKMQKQVYRVRTQVQSSARLALDMWREAQAQGRQQTRASLHRARAG